jgi:hypothetical protein
MKKPFLFTALALVLTLGIAGAVNAAINPNSQQPLQSTPYTSAAYVVNNADNSPVPSANSTGQITNQPLNQPTTTTKPSEEPSVVPPSREPSNVTASGQYYMYGPMNGTAMMSEEGLDHNNMPYNTPYNTPMNQPESQQRANVSPSQSFSRGNSYAGSMSGRSMGRMGR